MDWRTKLLNPTPHARQDYQSLATPVYRGSTVVFNKQNAVRDDWRQAENGYSYGLYGTPTSLELAARIANMKGQRDIYCTGGQAALPIYLLLSTQSCTVPFPAYGPNKAMAEGLMRGLNVNVEPYDPLIGLPLTH